MNTDGFTICNILKPLNHIHQKVNFVVRELNLNFKMIVISHQEKSRCVQTHYNSNIALLHPKKESTTKKNKNH